MWMQLVKMVNLKRWEYDTWKVFSITVEVEDKNTALN